MKTGFFIRKIIIKSEEFLRIIANLLGYLIWLIFSFEKFKKIKTSNIKKIMVYDSSGMGDIINTLGVINSFKNKNKQIEVFLITKENIFPLIKGNQNLAGYSSNFHDIIKNNFIDVAIMMNAPSEIIFEMKNSGKIREIIYLESYSIASAFNKDQIFTSRKMFPKNTHWIKRRIDCFKKIGFDSPISLTYVGNKMDNKKAKAFLKKINPKSKKIILMHPDSGTSEKARKYNKFPSHDWPLENFARLADMLIERHNCLVLIVGSKNSEDYDKMVISFSKNQKSIINVCGIHSIGEFAELSRLSDLLISIDTGTVHIAAQTGIPTIDLMGPYDPKLYCAWNPSENIEKSKAVSIFHPEVCSKCRKYYCPESDNICMKSISVEEVFFLCQKFLK